MSNFLGIPKIALNTNYPVGVEIWSNTPTRVQPTTDWENNGWTPGTPIPAQFENWTKGRLAALAEDNQRNAALKVVAGGIDTATPAHAGWFRNTKRVPLNYDASFKSFSPDFRRTIPLVVVGGVELNAIKGAYSTVGSGRFGCFIRNVTGGSANLDVYTDVTTPVHALRTLPGAGAVYTDACTDVDSGKFIAVAGNSALAADVGFAASDLSVNPVFAAVTIPVVWAAQANMSVASKPGETRAFSYYFTFRTTDGGTTATDFENVGYTGFGGAPAGNLFKPAWDSVNNRWITSIAKLSVSAADSAANSVLATSTDGETWTYLADAPAGVVITTILEYRGWLWAIGRCLPDEGMAGGVGHGGLEVFFSTDGGETWSRPGIVLSFVSLGFGATEEGHYHHCSSIVPMDNHLLFQTTISQPTDAGWVTGTAGKGLEYVVIHHDWNG